VVTKISSRKSVIFGLITILILSLLLGLVLWRLTLAHDVHVRLAAIRTAGLPTNWKELNDYYPPVPDNENAALVATQAFALLRDFTDSRSNDLRNFQIPPRGQPLTSDQKELLTKYVGMNSTALIKMREALKLPKSRYPVDFRLGVEFQIPHLAPLKQLGKIAVFEGLLELESGHTTAADTSIKTILETGRTLDDEPETTSWLIRKNLIDRAVKLLERRLNLSTGTGSELASLALDFTLAEKTNLLTRTLIADRARAIPYFRLTWAQMKRMSEASGDTDTSNLPASDHQPMLFWISGSADRDLRFYLDVMETNIAIISLLPPRSYAILAKDDLVEIERHHYKISSMFLPELSGSVDLDAAYLAGCRLAQTALAIERSRLSENRWPESLDELVPEFISAVPMDPFDGHPLRYRRLTKGYLVYSVAPDHQDNGGRERPATAEHDDKTPYDMTFTVER
jgi:hypothetical protein